MLKCNVLISALTEDNESATPPKRTERSGHVSIIAYHAVCVLDL
jgi:hypothetical protein